MAEEREEEKKVRIKLTGIASVSFLRNTLGLKEEEREEGKKEGFFKVQKSIAIKLIKDGNAVLV